MELELSVFSERGGRRTNEDAYGFWTSQDRRTCFCVVSDGAGGHGGGEVASRLAVEHLLGFFRARPECSREAIQAALAAANAAVIDQQTSAPRLANMRATAVVLALDRSARLALWGHLGDSRLYLFRRRRILVQTEDHSVVQGLVSAGYVERSALRNNAQRNTLLAALGDEEAFSPCVVSEPFAVEDGDLFLLCTDGLWEHVEEPDMERLLDEAPSSESWLERLHAQVVRQGATALDNYSALAVACHKR